MSEFQYFDVIVLGGGAAGLMAAATAAERGRRVLVIEVSNKLGKKILMSGGGRCNFTNLEIQASHYLCRNPHFVKSALNQYSQWDFISLVSEYEIHYHEKSQGQLFCDHSAKEILAMLESQCQRGGVQFKLDTTVEAVDYHAANDPRFSLQVENAGSLSCQSLVVATGGLSIPTLGGATGFGYQLAEQFGLQVLPRAASLVPFTLTGSWLDFSSGLSGVSLAVQLSVNHKSFADNMLFTHRGISGPAVLQISNYWQLGEAIEIDLLPSHDMEQELIAHKQATPNKKLQTTLLNYLPKSVVASMFEYWWPKAKDKTLQEFSKQALKDIAKELNRWLIKPSGTEGYRTAEVTKGGVSVEKISSKTMQHKEFDGLFFIGEVLDVTGHLGGYNFQWAWSSGYVAGMNA